MIRDFLKMLKEDNISSFAAGSAFFFFLSMAPITMIVCGILSFFPTLMENIILSVISITPDTFEPLMITLITQIYERTKGVLPIAILVTVWSSGKGMLGLMRALNEINGVEENRNYIRLRVMASFYTLVTIGGLLTTLGIVVFGNGILRYLEKNAGPLSLLVQGIYGMRFVFVWLFLTVAFTIIYTYIPNKPLKMRFQIPGAVFSALTWSVFSFLFSIYMNSGNAMSLYGSLSTIVLFMLWMYFCIYILLIGANFNKYFRPVIRVFLKKK